MRARAGHVGAHFGRSELYKETDSGAVSAGSNPAGGTAQMYKFEHSDNLGPTRRQPRDLRQCSAVPALAPDTRRKADTSLEGAWSAVLSDNGPQVVALTADRCSSQYPSLVGGAGDPVGDEAGQVGGAEVADVAVPQAGQAGYCQRQRDAAEP